VDIDLDVVEARIDDLETRQHNSDLEELVAIARDLLFRVRWWESVYPKGGNAPTKAMNDAFLSALDALE